MTPEELYAIWAPPDSIWSPWVIPVPFAQIICLEADYDGAEETDAAASSIEPADDLAIVVDMPGRESVRFGLALAKRGFRPVPVIDGSPGPWMIPVHPRQPIGGASKAHRVVVVDMGELLKALCAGKSVLPGMPLPPNAPPAFLIDSMRMSGEQIKDKEMFDNRWKVFPQDFPSANFLKQRGIRRILLVQPNAGQPKEDLAHVVLRWQEASLEILVLGKESAGMQPIRVAVPSRFRASWYRGLEILRLRRSSVGGFGAWPYQGASG